MAEQRIEGRVALVRFSPTAGSLFSILLEHEEDNWRQLECEAFSVNDMPIEDVNAVIAWLVTFARERTEPPRVVLVLDEDRYVPYKSAEFFSE